MPAVDGILLFYGRYLAFYGAVACFLWGGSMFFMGRQPVFTMSGAVSAHLWNPDSEVVPLIMREKLLGVESTLGDDAGNQEIVPPGCE